MTTYFFVKGQNMKLGKYSSASTQPAVNCKMATGCLARMLPWEWRKCTLCAELIKNPKTGVIIHSKALWSLLEKCYTGWPRKNATTLIVNFKNIVDETELFFFYLVEHSFSNKILARQCRFQNVLLFRPSGSLEPQEFFTSRRQMLRNEYPHLFTLSLFSIALRRLCQQYGTPWV